MLVLSRRPNQKICFPNINTSIQVVSITKGAVRLGVDAPSDIAVVREELMDQAEDRSARAPLTSDAESRLRELRHLVRNRLNIATVGVAVLRKQLASGTANGLDRTLVLIEEEMRTLRERLDAETTSPSPSQIMNRARRKALLVEDDQNESELLASFLRISGFAVDTARDGSDALDYLRRGERPDVVLLDMGLPRCDGATTAREIRRDPAYAGLKIFAVTGHSPEEYNVEKGPGGINRWFSKPLDPVSLVHELRHELSAN